MTHPTDFRALCAELVDEWDSLPWEYDWKGNPVSLGESVDLDFSVVDRARAALSAAPQQGPTIDDISELCDEFNFPLREDEAGSILCQAIRLWEMANAILTRYGAQPAPVPVAERLPWKGDKNEDGACWWFNRSGIPEWQLADGGPYGDYWLPHWALPLPEVEP